MSNLRFSAESVSTSDSRDVSRLSQAEAFETHGKACPLQYRLRREATYPVSLWQSGARHDRLGSSDDRLVATAPIGLTGGRIDIDAQRPGSIETVIDTTPC